MTSVTQVQDIKLQIEMAASPERVFDALTRNDVLQAWFCERADVSTAESRYDFWGRFTPEAPAHEGGRHPIVGFEPGRSIAYEWIVRGGPTRVEYRVEESGDGTRVAVAHRGLRPRAREEASLTDWWGLCLENLKAWLERGAPGPRRDHAMKPGRETKLTVEIDAPREAVFRALTDPVTLERYIAETGKAVVDARVGGRYDFGWGDEGGPVQIVAFEPDAKLAYSWRFEQEPDTVVTWTLEGSDKRTRLTLTHVGFQDDSLFDAYVTGWSKFLNRVKHLVEGGDVWERAVAAAHDF